MEPVTINFQCPKCKKRIFVTSAVITGIFCTLIAVCDDCDHRWPLPVDKVVAYQMGLAFTPGTNTIH